MHKDLDRVYFFQRGESYDIYFLRLQPLLVDIPTPVQEAFNIDKAVPDFAEYHDLITEYHTLCLPNINPANQTKSLQKLYHLERMLSSILILKE